MSQDFYVCFVVVAFYSTQHCMHYKLDIRITSNDCIVPI